MGLVNGISINPVDNTFSSQSIPASSTIIHDTISGKGFISISTKGNGNKKVNVVVSVVSVIVYHLFYLLNLLVNHFY